jgi:hypothetical protein
MEFAQKFKNYKILGFFLKLPKNKPAAKFDKHSKN